MLLPTGEQFHIVTALPALFLRRGRPGRSGPPVDLDRALADDADPSALRIGVLTARDPTWKEALDAFTCTECGRCNVACPTFLTDKPHAPKWVHDALKHHPVEQRQSLLEHLPRFYRLRQHPVMMAGRFPHELKAVFEGSESQANPWGLPAGRRADWARDLDLPRWSDASQAGEVEFLFYVGSAQSYDPRGRRIARAFVKVLRSAGVRFAILGEAEGSTGECARRLGNEMLFQRLAGTLGASLVERGVRHVVTCDLHAFNALSHEVPAFSGPPGAAQASPWTVEHHSQCIARLLREGRLHLGPPRAAALPGASRAAPRRVVFHDPCHLGRHNGENAAPRAVVALATGAPPLEAALHGPMAMCCGADGGRMWREETVGRRINVLRAEQLLEGSPVLVATACPCCALMIDDGLKALRRDSQVVMRDIAELVAEALPPGSHREAVSEPDTTARHSMRRRHFAANPRHVSGHACGLRLVPATPGAPLGRAGSIHSP